MSCVTKNVYTILFIVFFLKITVFNTILILILIEIWWIGVL